MKRILDTFDRLIYCVKTVNEKLVKCENCAYCNEKELTCYPALPGCTRIWRITEEDLTTMSRCDLFIPKEGD